MDNRWNCREKGDPHMAPKSMLLQNRKINHKSASLCFTTPLNNPPTLPAILLFSRHCNKYLQQDWRTVTQMGVQGGNLFFDPKEPLQCMADTSKKTKLYFGEGRSDIKPFVPLSHNCGYFTRSLCSFHPLHCDLNRG